MTNARNVSVASFLRNGGGKVDVFYFFGAAELPMCPEKKCCLDQATGMNQYKTRPLVKIIVFPTAVS